MTGMATVIRINDEKGERAVVTQADDEIHIARELWRLVADPMRESRIAGDLEVTKTESGDTLLSFGTPDEGMGRLLYRVTRLGERGYVVCERVPNAA